MARWRDSEGTDMGQPARNGGRRQGLRGPGAGQAPTTT